MGARRKAREQALSSLFAWEYGQDFAGDDLIARLPADPDAPPDDAEFARELGRLFLANRKAVDALIEKYSSNWKLSRMAAVDRNVLRLGVTEMRFFPNIPRNVTINEYLEVAKKFGSEDSSAFVNGVLDQLDKQGTTP